MRTSCIVFIVNRGTRSLKLDRVVPALVASGLSARRIAVRELARREGRSRTQSACGQPEPNTAARLLSGLRVLRGEFSPAGNRVRQNVTTQRMLRAPEPKRGNIRPCRGCADPAPRWPKGARDSDETHRRSGTRTRKVRPGYMQPTRREHPRPISNIAKWGVCELAMLATFAWRPQKTRLRWAHRAKSWQT